MGEEKSTIRKQLRQARFELSTADYTRGNRAICKRLTEAMDWSTVKNLHFFEPMHELMEMDILDFITVLQDDYLDMHLATSRKIGKDWQLVSLSRDTPPQSYDVIIVPMLGFDSDLQRIGFGGGYYDRFLATQPQAKKIGVCFEAGKVDKLPAESHDIPLDTIITEASIY